MLFRRTSYTVERNLCRNCALSIGRDYQSSTLLQGWWGIISLVVNIGTIINNTTELRRADKMAQPIGVSTSLNAGLPVLRRGKSIMGLIAIASVLAFGINRAMQPDPLPLEVGSCLKNLDNNVEIVSCASPHDGVVVQEVVNDSDCPDRSDGTFELETGGYLCVDEVTADGSN